MNYYTVELLSPFHIPEDLAHIFQDLEHAMC